MNLVSFVPNSFKKKRMAEKSVKDIVKVVDEEKDIGPRYSVTDAEIGHNKRTLFLYLPLSLNNRLNTGDFSFLQALKKRILKSIQENLTVPVIGQPSYFYNICQETGGISLISTEEWTEKDICLATKQIEEGINQIFENFDEVHEEIIAEVAKKKEDYETLMRKRRGQ